MTGGDARPLAIALLGPTGSGKTDLALELAEHIGGEIVSIDSALVYRGLDIGSAKPSAQEQRRAPHHLIDIRDPWQPYSVAEFVEDARSAVAGIVERGALPILAGGTSLYAHALFCGLAPMPAADAGTRAAISAEAELQGWPALHAELALVDPEAAARIHATDPQRIQRALEVFRLSGKPITQWQREHLHAPRWPVRVLKLALVLDSRDELHARIERRFDAMLERGFLDEVRRLRALPQLANHPAPLDLPAIRAVGYRQAWEHLDGRIDAGDFRSRAIYATRQLAKRQMTWLRAQLDVRRFDAQRERGGIVDALGLFLRGTPLGGRFAGFR
ncbi:tRNA (adenosine(37)-N6)-dimethylallyltransferase MiaA [Solilutibacter silvestris]|uniref:tRNA dimethylallyltransferase n=1 Tax=Solilutibacter silvestris TaxID=1645665 RepID=A0A2K1Q413_9GAMM|nr:tRNA (adenosine(37)-N6)-dimethylallyltransferase MiaA [Lysobacter silvestris]PNS09687.1 miaA: tRNA dimethylallyltransferase [Lysobacter silvestris]